MSEEVLPLSVDITTSGRGGSIYFRQGPNTVPFSWEFAMPPALALIFGTQEEYWDTQFPWALGKQKEIFRYTAEEVARQKAAGARFIFDLETGIITIYQSSAGQGQGERSQAVPVKVSSGYGLRTEVVEPPKKDQLREDLHDHLSIDKRLGAAETLLAQGKMTKGEFAEFLATQIRKLYLQANGLERALRMAETHDGEIVRQALLWASYNATECTRACAELLLKITGAAAEPLNESVRRVLEKLGVHNSSFDRQAAFDGLCELVKMKLDTAQGE